MLRRQLPVLERQQYCIFNPCQFQRYKKCHVQTTSNSRSITSLTTTRFQPFNSKTNHVRAKIIQTQLQSTRPLSTATVFSILTPPLVLVGLTVSLWLYKCLMMIIFQNKIIYMPSMPPFSRSEKIEDYEAVCRPVGWREVRIRSVDGVKIALCVGCYGRAWDGDGGGCGKKRRHLVILYFQGNGASTPPRLPLLSSVLKQLYNSRPASRPTTEADTDTDIETDYTIVAPSYRGFWTSRGRPTQRGIELDALASLAWVRDQFNSTHTDAHTDTQIVLWGQSIGAGVATGLAAAAATPTPSPTPDNNDKKKHDGNGAISALILETPFTSIKSMLLALYPQRWLPYRYLTPFLRNHWDSEQAIQSLSTTTTTSNTSTSRRKVKVLIVSSEKDELVPPEQAGDVQEMCTRAGLEVRRCRVGGALHNDATVRAEGRNAVVEFLKDV